MSFDAYVRKTLDAVGLLVQHWAGTPRAGHNEALIGLAAAFLVLWLSTILATRLLAQVSSGGAFGLALTWAVLLFVNHAGTAIYALGPGAQAAATLAMLVLMVFAGTRALNTSWPRAITVLVVSFGLALVGCVFVSLFWKMISAI